MSRSPLGALAAAAALVGACAGRPAAPAPAGTALFDGRSLDGWQLVGGGRAIALPDGGLRLEGGRGALYTARRYGDFALDVDVKVDAGNTDSGILLRADSARPGAGYQVQIRDAPREGPYERYVRTSGAIDRLAAPTRNAARMVGAWNHYRVEVAGQRYRVFLNGELVNDFFGSREREGLIGLQSPDTTPGVTFRDIRLTPLDGGPTSLGEALAAPASARPVRVLVVTATHGFRHTEAIDAAREVLPELARTTEMRFDFSDSAGAITAANLARYDVLFLSNATLRAAPADTTEASRAAVRVGRTRDPLARDLLTRGQLDALDAFVRSGKGLVLTHSALDALYGVPAYRAMVGGGLFEMHPWILPARYVVEDRSSATTSHFGADVWIRDEVYVLDVSPRATSRVLLSIDKASAGPPNVPTGNQPLHVTPAVARDDHPISWVRRHGDGRVFATVLGHFGDVWRRPDFLRHLLQGIRVAAGTVPAELAPVQTPRPSDR